MMLRDRKKLAKLMVIQEVSQRQLAAAAGWGASHSFVSRLLKGEVSTMNTDSAVRIAHHFGVPLEDLFVTKLTTKTERVVPSNKTKAVK